MSEKAQFSVYVFLFLLGVIPMLWHIKVFNALEKSVAERLGEIWGEYKERRLITFTSSGAIPNLKHIERKYGAELTDYEWALVRKSRRLYYLGGTWMLVVFWVFFAIILLT
jgi:hypothetical protein